nr:MAG TPA: hypothetical protein [Caudoviricetes sp.]
MNLYPFTGYLVADYSLYNLFTIPLELPIAISILLC